MQIAQMLAVIISKIARIDYPKEWYFFYVHLCRVHEHYAVYTTAIEISIPPVFASLVCL